MVDVVCYPTNMTLHENVVAGMNLYLNTENNNEKKAPFYLMHFNEWPALLHKKQVQKHQSFQNPIAMD